MCDKRYALYGEDIFAPNEPALRTEHDELAGAIYAAQQELADERGLSTVWILDRRTGEKIELPVSKSGKRLVFSPRTMQGHNVIAVEVAS